MRRETFPGMYKYAAAERVPNLVEGGEAAVAARFVRIDSPKPNPGKDNRRREETVPYCGPRGSNS